jgi:hypothetical protein
MRCHSGDSGNAPESFLIAGCLRVKNIPSTIAARFEENDQEILEMAHGDRSRPNQSPNAFAFAEASAHLRTANKADALPRLRKESFYFRDELPSLRKEIKARRRRRDGSYHHRAIDRLSSIFDHRLGEICFALGRANRLTGCVAAI